MTLSTKHKFQSAKADGTDNTLVKPSNWKDDHNLATDAVTGGVILGRAEGAGPGPITDMPFSSVLPAGIMLPYAGATVPGGWLLCDGRQVLRSDFPALFAAIGTTWNTGTVDALHFCLPDLRGRVPAGLDGGTGRLPLFTALGHAGGESAHTLLLIEAPSHDHAVSASVSDPGHGHLLPIENLGLGGSGGGNVPQAITGNMYTYSVGTGISVVI